MDLTVTIDVSDVSYNSWLRTSYSGLSIVDKKGIPKLETIELGPDERDAFNSFLKEASREVLKCFVTRQGDVEGIPYEYSTTEVVYRFLEGIPALSINQTSSLMTQLTETVEDAIYSYVSRLWFNIKQLPKIAALYDDRYTILTDDIDRSLYRLHS